MRRASAQAVKPIVIGQLDAGDRREWWAAFREQLRELGYVEGQNVAFEARFASGKFDRLTGFAEELVRLKVAIIVTSGSAAREAAKRATATIPIVVTTSSGSTVGIASLARPGGNVTGVTSIAFDLTAKRFDVLREAVPKLSRLGVLWHRDNPTSANIVRELEIASRPSKVTLQLQGVKSSDEIPSTFAVMTRERVRAIFVVSDPLFHSERKRIADLAITHKLPNIHSASEYVEAGGLLSYGPSYSDLFRRAAVYVDKILKGAKPADLPIEQPTKLELVINAKTARAIGLTIPRQVLLRADRVIE